MPRYIDADALIEELKSLSITVTGLRAGKNVLRVLMNEYIKSIWKIVDEQPTANVVEVVRCKDCDVPHNRWTGCPNLNGLIPPPNYYCARGERKQPTVDVTDINVGDKPSCKVCERISEANKDIFWVFARTHQPQDKEEFHRVPVRFCPVCGREISKNERRLEPHEEKENQS